MVTQTDFTLCALFPGPSLQLFLEVNSADKEIVVDGNAEEASPAAMSGD
jgi:hypothetical protein